MAKSCRTAPHGRSLRLRRIVNSCYFASTISIRFGPLTIFPPFCTKVPVGAGSESALNRSSICFTLLRIRWGSSLSFQSIWCGVIFVRVCTYNTLYRWSRWLIISPFISCSRSFNLSFLGLLWFFGPFLTFVTQTTPKLRPPTGSTLFSGNLFLFVIAGCSFNV